MKYYKYCLVDYFDVWGNRVDGYEVNNLTRITEFYCSEEVSDIGNIIKYLKPHSCVLI
jgi:hypothetical protein